MQFESASQFILQCMHGNESVGATTAPLVFELLPIDIVFALVIFTAVLSDRDASITGKNQHFTNEKNKNKLE